MVESSKSKATVSQPKTDQQNDALERFNQAIERAEAALATSSPNAPDRYKKLDDLACTLADKACYIKSNKVGMLLEALEYAKQALQLVPDNHVREDGLNYDGDAAMYKNKGTVCNTMRAIYSDLYWETKDSKYLDEAITLGIQATEFAAEHKDQYPSLLYQRLHSRRLNFLADLYKTRFDNPDQDSEIGAVEDDLDRAIDTQTDAMEESPDGEDAYLRLCKWCDLMVLKSGLRNDLQYIDRAITRRSEQTKILADGAHTAETPEHDVGNKKHSRAVHNDSEKNVLLCRRWQMTGADDDFQKILNEARTMTPRAIEMGKVSDGDGTKEILHSCASYLTWILTRDSQWEKHIPTIETAIALYTELVNIIPMNTKEAIEERNNPMAELTGFMQKRWKITQKPRHGFELDMVNVYSAQQGVAMSMLQDDMTNIDVEGTKHVAYGKSAGSGEMFWTFDPPRLPLRQQRLCFINETTPENWVRERNDDGTLVLGATETDTDIWEFCQRYNKGKECKEEGAEQTLPSVGQIELAGDDQDDQERSIEQKQEN